jgi:hypothetical protein
MVIKVIRLRKGPLGADAELVIAYLKLYIGMFGETPFSSLLIFS